MAKLAPPSQAAEGATDMASARSAVRLACDRWQIV